MQIKFKISKKLDNKHKSYYQVRQCTSNLCNQVGNLCTVHYKVRKCPVAKITTIVQLNKHNYIAEIVDKMETLLIVSNEYGISPVIIKDIFKFWQPYVDAKK